MAGAASLLRLAVGRDRPDEAALEALGGGLAHGHLGRAGGDHDDVGVGPRICSTAASWLPAWALGVVWTLWASAWKSTPLTLAHSATPVPSRRRSRPGSGRP